MHDGKVMAAFVLLMFAFLANFPVESQCATYHCTTVSEFNTAEKQALPGDVIELANGTWKNVNLEINAIGKSSSLITLKAETAGKVYLTGSSTLKIGGKYIVVDGLVFRDGYLSSGDHVIVFRDSSENPASYCRLTNCAMIEYNPSDTNTQYN